MLKELNVKSGDFLIAEKDVFSPYNGARVAKKGQKYLVKTSTNTRITIETPGLFHSYYSIVGDSVDMSPFFSKMEIAKKIECDDSPYGTRSAMVFVRNNRVYLNFAQYTSPLHNQISGMHCSPKTATMFRRIANAIDEMSKNLPEED